MKSYPDSKLKSKKTIKKGTKSSIDKKSNKAILRKKKEGKIESQLGAPIAGDEEATQEQALDCSQSDARLLQESLRKSLKTESTSFLDSDALSGSNVVHLEGSHHQRLESRLKTACASWKLPLCVPIPGIKNNPQKDKKVRAPSLLILTASAVRALEIMRELPSFNRACRIHKLFSKHIKVEEQAVSLDCHLCLAVGTPNRVQKLVEREALDLTELKVVMLDTKPDSKTRHILTIPEIRDDFWRLYDLHLRSKIQVDSLKLCLC